MHGATRRRPSRCPRESGICCGRRSAWATSRFPNGRASKRSAASVGTCHPRTATRWPTSSAAKNCGVDDARPAAARRRQVHTGSVAAQGPGAQDAPDAVLLPVDEDEVAEMLRYCCAAAQHRGGAVRRGHQRRRRPRPRPRPSSAPSSRWTCAGSTNCTSLDEISGEADLGAGVTGPEAERLLGERGFSLGHFPQSFRVRDDRRIRGDPFIRAGLGGLRPVRRHGPRTAR